MPLPAIQALDSRHPVIVSPSEIRVGDWLRDLGSLRQVEAVETAAGACAEGVSVRFVGGADGAYATLIVGAGVSVTVWRTLEAAGHAPA